MCARGAGGLTHEAPVSSSSNGTKLQQSATTSTINMPRNGQAHSTFPTIALLALDFAGVGMCTFNLQDLRAVGTTPLHGRHQFLATYLLHCKNSMVLKGTIKPSIRAQVTPQG